MIFNGYSRPINRGLFTIFMLCQIAEQSGHGIPTIVKKYGKEAFDFSGSAIKVTIKYAFNLLNSSDNAVENVPVNVGVKMSNSEMQVYNEIKNNVNITAQEISKKLNKTKRTIERIFTSLKEKRIIKRVGSDKTGHWEICQ